MAAGSCWQRDQWEPLAGVGGAMGRELPADLPPRAAGARVRRVQAVVRVHAQRLQASPADLGMPRRRRRLRAAATVAGLLHGACRAVASASAPAGVKRRMTNESLPPAEVGSECAHKRGCGNPFVCTCMRMRMRMRGRSLDPRVYHITLCTC